MTFKEGLRNLKITPKIQWKAISPSIGLAGIVFLGILFYIGFETIKVVCAIIIYAIDTVPVIIAHVRYFKRNKDESYYIRSDGFIYRKKGQAERFYPKEEIQHIEIFLSEALSKNKNRHALRIEVYHYARIYLKDGSELIVTSLMSPYPLTWHFGLIRGVKIKKVIRLYNFI